MTQKMILSESSEKIMSQIIIKRGKREKGRKIKREMRERMIQKKLFFRLST